MSHKIDVMVKDMFYATIRVELSKVFTEQELTSRVLEILPTLKREKFYVKFY